MMWDVLMAVVVLAILALIRLYVSLTRENRAHDRYIRTFGQHQQRDTEAQ